MDLLKGTGIETHRLRFRDLIQEVMDDYDLNNKRSIKRLNGKKEKREKEEKEQEAMEEEFM